MDIIVLQDKHGPSMFRTARGALKHQIEEMYAHLGEPEVVAAAEEIMAFGTEAQALRFLRSRSQGEYEGFYTETLGD